ncbi:DNA modification methylase [Flavobacterium magnum]|uniref:DNA modification methylase n=1 Tax=Flavobacterium magnum TaxID=2162713 RepID=A0A2S0REX2_9FLAO|nr:DNA modification methylase [Flavobacterium magnum]AWA30313.1 DNA modification methylase [Flavobacterium magnum]
MMENISISQTLAAIKSEILNGENHDKREFIRKLLNYPAMMVPSVQESIINALITFLPKDSSLIDPFMGAGNTLVAGMKYGFNVFGQDINPLSVLIGQVKTACYDEKELHEANVRIQAKIKEDVTTIIDVNFKNIGKWFKPEVLCELSRIRRAILTENDYKIRKFFWVTLAETVRLTSNDRTSTFKMHIRSEEDINTRSISPIKIFANTCKKSIADICDFMSVLNKNKRLTGCAYNKKAEVIWGNSLDSIKTDKKYQLLLTSPPYGDNHTTVTYGQFSYLPLQWIPVEEIDITISINYRDIITQIDTESLGGSSKPRIWIEEELFAKSKTLKNYFDSLDKSEKLRAQKVINFTDDLDKTIDKILLKLDKNAFQVWTLGNRYVNNREVKNDLIITELLHSKGAEIITDLHRDILSKRMPGRNNFSNTMTKEKILIFKTCS